MILSEIGFFCVALGALELSIDQVGLDQISACLCLRSQRQQGETTVYTEL